MFDRENMKRANHHPCITEGRILQTSLSANTSQHRPPTTCPPLPSLPLPLRRGNLFLTWLNRNFINDEPRPLYRCAADCRKPAMPTDLRWKSAAGSRQGCSISRTTPT